MCPFDCTAIRVPDVLACENPSDILATIMNLMIMLVLTCLLNVN